MLLSGVRNSWLTVAKKSLFSRFISYSRMLAWASSSSRSSNSLLLCRKSLCWLSSWRNMRLNAAPSSSNSSPVRIDARCSTSPSRTALATSRRCVTGFTITYRTTAHNENIETNPTTIAAVHSSA